RTSKNTPLMSPPNVNASPTMPDRPSTVTTPRASFVRVGSQVRVTSRVDVGAIVGVATAGVVRVTAGLAHATNSRPSTIKDRTLSIQTANGRVPPHFCENRHIRLGGT